MTAAESTGITQGGSVPSVRDERTAALDWCDTNEALLCEESSEPVLCHESVDPSDIDEPIEKAEANQPTEPIDSTEPTDPIDRSDPSEQIEKVLPRDRIDDWALCAGLPTFHVPSGRRARNAGCGASSFVGSPGTTRAVNPAPSRRCSQVCSGNSP